MAVNFAEEARRLGGTLVEEPQGAAPTNRAQTVAEIAAQFGGTLQPTTPAPPEGFATLQEVPGGGRLVRAPDGSVSFASPSFSTTDPEFIAQIQAGKSIDEAVMAARNKALLNEPGQMAGAIAASAQRGVPFVGSYGDEAAGYVVPGGGERYNRLTEALTARYPGRQLAAELFGGIGSALAGGGLIGGVPRFLSMAQRGTRASQAAAAGITGAGVGATEGAIYGAGEGEGRGRLAHPGRP